MRYRSQSQIIQSILETALTPVSKTRIMYKAYLSYTQVTNYLTLLVKSGLLKENKTNHFEATDKAKEFIKYAKAIQELTE
uniref:ORF18 n=1 Tax=Nitrosopumilaceae spindle-shaped virus TaxID=3065433 RepID=A0AAT9J9W3_9VIRU